MPLTLLLACSSSEPAKQEAQQTIEDFAMTQTESGARIWQLKAPHATLSMEGEARLQSPEIQFYRAGKHVSSARSKEALVHGSSGDVSMLGDVIIDSLEEKSRLTTDSLDYHGAEKRFRTDQPVLVKRPGAVIRGKGMDADSSLSEINIYEQRTVTE